MIASSEARLRRAELIAGGTGPFEGPVMIDFERGRRSGDKRILIADDEINIRRVLEAILKRDGYEVVTAANGEEALARMGRGIHTVITDLKMPVWMAWAC
jgi:PleD family two-component response regulator